MRRKTKIAGQGLVEFALLLPVLLAIVVGTMEFGRLLFLYVSINNAVREGARYGMVNPSDVGGIVNHTMEKIQLVSCPTPAVSYDNGSDTVVDVPMSGGRVRVSMVCTIEPLTPLLEPFMPDGLTISTENRRTIQSVKTAATSTPGPWANPPEPPTMTPQTTATSTVEPGATETPPPTATNTSVPATSTPTLTPTPLPPIIIDRPVQAGDTVVSGQAAAGYGVTLRVIQTGLQRTVTVAPDGVFTFSDLPELVAGQTVVVQGYGSQDLVIVEAIPTPTPTSTEVPTDAYIYIDATCLESGSQSLLVHGRNWESSGNSKIDELRFYWDGSQVDTRAHDWKQTSFDETISVTVEEPGPHTLLVQGYYSSKNRLIEEAQITVQVCQPTPTPSPTPVTDPDLQIIDLHVTDDPIPGTYERVHVSVTVYNAGDADITSLFWVDLFADPDEEVSLQQQASVDYVAVNALQGGTAITFTMYVPDGFDTVGTHTLVAMADTWDQIAEDDESNNVSATETITITVANLSPTPTPEVTPGPTGTVGGSTYLEGLPQSFVSVYLYDEEGRLWASGRSNQDGAYEFTDIPVGEYSVVGQLRLSDKVYIDIQPVTITADGYSLVNLNLEEL